MAVRTSLVLAICLACVAAPLVFAQDERASASANQDPGDFLGDEPQGQATPSAADQNGLPGANSQPEAASEGKRVAIALSEPEAVASKLAIRDALDHKDAPAAERLFQEALKRFPLDPDLREVADRRMLQLHDEKVRAIFGRAKADGARLFGHQWLPGRTQEDKELGIGMDQDALGPGGRRNSDPAIKAALTEGYRSLDRGDPARAEKVLSGAIRRRDDSPELYYARVLARGMSGNLKKADEDSLKAVTLSREEPVALSQRASLMMTMGRRQEAFAWANRALEGNPQDADALVIRGRFLWKDRNRPDLAVEDLKKAAQIDPEHCQKLYEEGNRRFLRGRAMDSIGKGDYKQALSDANQVLKIDPADAQAHTVRGNVFLKAGKVEETIKETTLALKSDPGSKWALFFRAQAMEALGARSRALVDLKRAAGIDPGKFGPLYEKLVRAQREGAPPLWPREGQVGTLAASH